MPSGKVINHDDVFARLDERLYHVRAYVTGAAGNENGHIPTLSNVLESSYMRVLHLSSERTWRGGEQQIAYLMGVLRTHGVESIVAARRGSVLADRLKGSFPVIELPFASELDIFTAWKLRQLVKDQRIDLVHMHSGHSHTLGVLSHALGHDVPLILSKRTDYPVKDNAFSRWKFNYPGIKRILCVSDKIRQIVSKDLTDPSKAITVYSGVDLQRFPQAPTRDIREIAGLDPSARVVVATAAISPQKDYATFLRVAAELRPHHPDLHFVICGDGPSEAEVKALAQTLNLTGRVHFLGFRNDVASFLGSADLFLITSREEGLGTSILDAFAVGLPVVGTAAGGIPEIVRHDDTGLLAPVGDFKMLATHVENLIYSGGLTRERLIQHGHALAKEFSYIRTGEKTLEVYRQVL